MEAIMPATIGICKMKKNLKINQPIYRITWALN